jgi:hypothetical protein
MPCPNPTDRAERVPIDPAADDRKTEGAVLAFVLEEHPNPLTIPEVSWALYPRRAEEFTAGDAVERAIYGLVGAKLLHCRDGFVLPTRAALYFARLEMD